MNIDVILNKVAIIDRCIMRINEEYKNNPENLNNFTKQDSIVLNLQRACKASIDLAMYICSQRKLGLPGSSRDAFILLAQNNTITNESTEKMLKMVGFRNIAVHDYQTLNLLILQSILENHLQDFTKYTKLILDNI